MLEYLVLIINLICKFELLCDWWCT